MQSDNRVHEPELKAEKSPKPKFDKSGKTDFSVIHYLTLDNKDVPFNLATAGNLMNQMHKTSKEEGSNPRMKKFSMAIAKVYTEMLTPKDLDIYDKMLRGTLLNGFSNDGLLLTSVGQNETQISKIRFGHLMACMLTRIKYILETFKLDHKYSTFKSPRFQEPFGRFKHDLTQFSDFLEKKCHEWKSLFQEDSTEKETSETTETK
jgi:hypothetical protein